MDCPHCGSQKTQRRGRGSRQCNACRKYFTEFGETSEAEYSENYINVVCASKRVLTEDDICKKFNIDKTKWKIVSFQVKTSEGYRKDRSVEWDVDAGIVTHGKVRDSGKMLVVPLYHVRAKFELKIDEIKDRIAIEDFIEKAKKYSPKHAAVKYPKQKGGVLMEIGLPDMQLGRMVMKEEAGENLDVDLALKRARGVVSQLISFSGGFSVGKILFPIGNDFFDSNTAEGKTAHGTPQRDDPRWQRTFKLGCEFAIDAIDELAQIAPVDVLIIPGNHDEERVFYMGAYLDAFYRLHKSVKVDNRPMKRKYYQFGKNLIGLTHGYYEKNEQLASLMAYEVPEMWAKTNYREWHLGDKHHKSDMIHKTKEMNGVVIRILRSIATPSVWEFDKGLVGSLKAGEAFLWHPDNGLIAQFTSTIEVE